MNFIKIKNEDYEMQDCSVTQNEWKEIMGKNPSHFKGENNPVENVSWNDCQEFIKKLNGSQKEYVYALPTEKQWEQCAQSCDEIPVLEQAWCYENSESKTHPVKKLKPNKLELYDMLGNVWEWCEDLWSKDSSFRVLRGGGWGSDAQGLRPALRDGGGPSGRGSNIGFRLVRISIKLSSLTLLPFESKSEQALAIARKALLEIESILKD